MIEIITKNNREYKFIKKVNEKLYLFEDIKIGCKTCFSEYDLGLNKKINYNSTKGNCTNYRKGF